MYQNTALQRPPDEEEDRLRREGIARSIQLPPYTARSPTQSTFNSYSPTNGSHRQTFDNRYHPPTPAPLPLPPTVGRSPQFGPPPPLITDGLAPLKSPAYSPRDKAPSTYYDPTSDHADRDTNRSQSHYSRHSPSQVGLPSVVFVVSQWSTMLTIPLLDPRIISLFGKAHRTELL